MRYTCALGQSQAKRETQMHDPEQEAIQRKLCVVVDTNAWRSSLLLRRASGVALLFYLKRMEGFLGLPEVLEQEWVKHAELELGGVVSRFAGACDITVLSASLLLRPLDYEARRARPQFAQGDKRRRSLAG
jgi:hypothetical protein